MADTTLSVNGEEHGGWHEVSVTRSLEQMAHTFDVSFFDRWSVDKAPIPIREGDECVVKLTGERVVTGYVDEAPIEYDVSNHRMHVSGRSRTADLVDCSAIRSGDWRDRDIEQIANDICSPFAITVRVSADVGVKFPTFSIHSGETAFTAIERGCRQRGVLLTTNGKGELVLTRIGEHTSDTVIEFGVNAFRGSRRGNWRDRFSTYIVKGQARGNDESYGKDVSQPKYEITDDEITRYRPLIINAEIGGVGNALKERATWERNVRAGRSTRLAYTLHGWTDDQGTIWAPNTLVRVKDKRLQVDTELLIVATRQSKTQAEGTSTDIELCDPKAMTVEPLTPQPRGVHRHDEFIRGNR